MDNVRVEMKAIRQLQLTECEIPVPKEDELLLKIAYVGLCGSDLHFYTEGHIGKRRVTRPFVLGHEVSAVVEKVGSGVQGFSVGDRVTLEPGIACRKCEYCLSGRYHLCPKVVFISNPPDDGAMQKYIVFPARLCFKLPDSISLEEGAMIEPLCVGLHAAQRGEVNMNSVVIVLGCGPIGIMTILSCKAFGAKRIIATDIREKRLAKAKEMGADFVVNAAADDFSQQISALTDGLGADVVFEAAGSPATMAQTSELVKRGGVIVIVGNVTKETSYNFLLVSNKEADIRPVYRYKNLYPTAINALASGKIDLKRIQPRVFPYTRAQEAFDITADGSNDVVKTLIQMNKL